MERDKIIDILINKLRNLNYVLGQRQVGHTTLMKKGVENYDREFGVIAHNKNSAESIIKDSKSKFGKSFSIRDLKSVRGFKMPFIVDNYVLNQLIDQVILVMEDSLTYEEIKKLTAPIMEMAEIYQERTHRIESLIIDYMQCNWWKFSAKIKLEKEILKTMIEANEDSRLDEIFKRFEQKIK
jgi:predicted AAA+ superfamily ATPase